MYMWLKATPFDGPVVPPVYIIAANSLGDTFVETSVFLNNISSLFTRFLCGSLGKPSPPEPITTIVVNEDKDDETLARSLKRSAEHTSVAAPESES